MKLFLVSLFFLLIFVFSPALLIPFADNRLSDFYYRELLYSNIAHENKSNEEKETITNLFIYVADNLSTSDSYNVVDKNPYTDAIRGIGWCDQQAFLLMNLLNKVNINRSRLRDVNAHTYSEVLIEKNWAIIDPYFGFIPQDKNKNFLGISNLDSKFDSDYFGIINDEIDKSSLNWNFKNIYVPNNIRWLDGIGPEFAEYRSYSFRRLFIEKYSNTIYKILGKKYFFWVQDVYLSSETLNSINDRGNEWIKSYSDNYNNNNESFVLFIKARNFDLADRNEKARNFYASLIETFPGSYWFLEAKYYLALLDYRNMNYIDSKQLLLELNKDSIIRKDLINYYLGMISIYNKNVTEAKNYFSKSDYYLSKVELNKLK
jgi:hypothetical protein